jgi:hypothetical protein
MSFKTPILCDRRIYDKRGKWKSPNNDIAENIFYFIKEPLTLNVQYDSYGREQVSETLSIVVFGGKQFIKEDTVILETGEEYKITNIIVNYAESNIMVKDLLKPRIESMELILD